MTKPAAASGRGLKFKTPKVKFIAERAGVKTFQPEKLSDVIEDLKELEPSHGVLVSYGKILPQEVIDIFPGGIINVHPSLLPEWRGPSPIETTILSGDEQTGISLMLLSAEMDAGPVYKQQVWPLNGTETRLWLYKQLAVAGASLLVDNLEAILDGTLEPKDQDESAATYSKILKKSDGLIDWDSESTMQIERKVRAYQGFPKTTAKIWDKYDVIVTKVRPAQDKNDGELVIGTKDSYIEVQELTAPSGRSVSGKDFKLGYKP